MKKEENTIVDFFNKSNNPAKKKEKTQNKTQNKIQKKKKSVSKTSKKEKIASKRSGLSLKKNKTSKSKNTITKKKNIKNQKTNIFQKNISKVKNSPKHIKEGIMNRALLLLLFLIPLFVTNQTFQGIDFEKNFLFVLIVSILVLFVSLKFINSREIKIRKTFLDKYILGIVLLFLVSTWFSVDRWHSLVGFVGNPVKGFMTNLVLIATFYIVVTGFTTKTVQKAFWVAIYVISLLAVYTLSAGFGLIPVKVQMLIPFSLTGSLRGLTMVLASGIPLLSVALLIVKNKSKKFVLLKELLLIAGLIVVLLTLVMLFHFIFWSGILVGLIIAGFLLLSYKQTKQKNVFLKGIIFSSFAFMIIFAGLAKSNYQSLIPILTKVRLPFEVEVGLPVSVDIIKGSVTGNLKQSLLGSGPATFGYDFAKFHSKKAVAPILESSYIYHGDGLFAEVIPTTGIVGGLLFLLATISWLAAGARSLNNNNQQKIYLIGLFSSSVILLSGVLFSQLDAGAIFFAGLLLMITTVLILENKKGRKEYYQVKLNKFTAKNLGGAVFLLAIIVMAVLALAYVSKAYLADVYMKQAMAEKTFDKKPAKMLKSIQLVPQEGIYYSKLGQTYLILAGAKSQQKNQDKQEEIKKLSEQALFYIKKATLLMPNDVRNQRVLAETYVSLGYYNLAENTYEKIIQLEPNNVQYYVALGELQLLKIKQDKSNKEEMVKKAIEFYQKALSVNPRTDIIYYKLALLYSGNNDIDNALKNIAIATKLQPNNTIYKFTLGGLLQQKGGEKELAGAEKIFKALLLLDDKSIDVVAQLGLLYEQEGKIDEAKKQYQQVIDIIGDNEKYQVISKTMKKFIENLDNGQSNLPANIKKQEQDKKETKKETNSTHQKEKLDEKATAGKKEGESKTSMITITVDEEGPINVRSEGSLQGKKLTKIKESGDFEKIGENDKWVQIIIPAQGEQEQITGWVHKKFVTAEK